MGGLGTMKLARLRAVWNTVPLCETLRCLAPHKVDHIIGDDVAAEEAGYRTADAAGSTTRK
jgi:hypothetical protein